MKGEGKPSPFLLWGSLVFLFIGICYGQFSLTRWLHPFHEQRKNIPTQSHFFTSHNSSIDFLQMDDSLKLTQSENSIGIQYSLNNTSHVLLEFGEKRYNFNYLTAEYGFFQELQNSTTTIGIKFPVYNRVEINLSLDMNAGSSRLYPHVFFYIKPWNGIEIEMGQDIEFSPFTPELYYSDFFYKISGGKQEKATKYIKGVFESNLYTLSQLSSISNLLLKGNNFHFEEGFSQRNLTELELTLPNESIINLTYQSHARNLSYDLKTDVENVFLYMNNMEFNTRYIQARIKVNKFSGISLGCKYQRGNMIISSRLRPSRVSSDLVAFFNTASIISAKTLGENHQFSLALKKDNMITKTLNMYYQVKWQQDVFDYNSTTTSLYLFGGIPNYFDDQDLNLTGVNAMGLQVGGMFWIGDWSIGGEFSQYIPYKTTVRKDYPQSGKAVEKKRYGGGLFNIFLIKSF